MSGRLRGIGGPRKGDRGGAAGDAMIRIRFWRASPAAPRSQRA
jgi:hypothetical protein